MKCRCGSRNGRGVRPVMAGRTRAFLPAVLLAVAAALLSFPRGAAAAEHPPRPARNMEKGLEGGAGETAACRDGRLRRKGAPLASIGGRKARLCERLGRHGRSFGSPVPVNTDPEDILGDGENRPKIVVARNGHIYISYTQALSKPMSGISASAGPLMRARTSPLRSR